MAFGGFSLEKKLCQSFLKTPIYLVYWQLTSLILKRINMSFFPNQDIPKNQSLRVHTSQIREGLRGCMKHHRILAGCIIISILDPVYGMEERKQGHLYHSRIVQIPYSSRTKELSDQSIIKVTSEQPIHVLSNTRISSLKN